MTDSELIALVYAFFASSIKHEIAYSSTRIQGRRRKWKNVFTATNTIRSRHQSDSVMFYLSFLECVNSLRHRSWGCKLSQFQFQNRSTQTGRETWQLGVSRLICTNSSAKSADSNYRVLLEKAIALSIMQYWSQLNGTVWRVVYNPRDQHQRKAQTAKVNELLSHSGSGRRQCYFRFAKQNTTQFFCFCLG